MTLLYTQRKVACPKVPGTDADKGSMDANELRKAVDALDVVENSLRNQDQIGTVICTLRDAYARAFRYTYEEINCGDCEDFAERVARILPEAETCWDDEIAEDRYFAGHCFIVYRGACYDSEAPDGVPVWTDLPCEQPFRS